MQQLWRRITAKTATVTNKNLLFTLQRTPYTTNKQPSDKLNAPPTKTKSTKQVVTNKKLSKSSKEWLTRQIRDNYVKMRNSGSTSQSKGINYRSRAGFKLQQLDEDFKFIQFASVIIDLGAAPGAWSQYCAKGMKKDGVLVSLDLLPMEPLSQSETSRLRSHIILQGDFTEEATVDAIKQALADAQVVGCAADVILSDMASNTTGIVDLDHGRIIQLCQSVLSVTTKGVLNAGGTLLLKILSGPEETQLRQELKRYFGVVTTVKPDASRKDSREMYIYCRNFVGAKVIQKKSKQVA